MNAPKDEPRQQPAADEAIARHREALQQRFPLPSVQPRAKRRVAPLAALLLAAGLLAWLDPAYRSEEYASEVGQRRSLTLSDDSHITLDGATRIAVSWHLRSRRVALLAGQASFDVASARYRPFRVSAGAAEVEVLGTRFNLDRQGDDLRVTVSEGRVAVRGNSASTQLTTGEQVLVQAGQLGATHQVNAADFSAWRDGRLVFQRTPLREVLSTLQRYRAAPIQLDEPSLAELPVSGVFDSDRIDNLLALLPSILPVELSHAADGSLQLRSVRGRK